MAFRRGAGGALAPLETQMPPSRFYKRTQLSTFAPHQFPFSLNALTSLGNFSKCNPVRVQTRNPHCRKNWLPQVGLKPTTLCSLDGVLCQLSYMGINTAGWAECQWQGKTKHLNLITEMYTHNMSYVLTWNSVLKSILP